MESGSTEIGGIVIPSTDPAFLAVVIGAHIPLGMACVIAGAAFKVRHDLLLVPVGPFCDGNLSLGRALVGKLSPVSFGCRRVRLRVVRSVSAPLSRAELDQASHSGDGPFLCRHVDRVLRGQREAVADLEGPPSLHLLAGAAGSCDATSHLGAAAAPAGSSRTFLRVDRMPA